jgi:hypothetical protein
LTKFALMQALPIKHCVIGVESHDFAPSLHVSIVQLIPSSQSRAAVTQTPLSSQLSPSVQN